VKFKIKNSINMSDYDVVNNCEIYGKSVSECMELVNERLYQQWQKRWDESMSERHPGILCSTCRNVPTCVVGTVRRPCVV